MTSLNRAPLPGRELRILEEIFEDAKQEQHIEGLEEESSDHQHEDHHQIDVAFDAPPGAPTQSPEYPNPTRNRQQSSVNAPRSQEDNKKFWGGKMVDSVQAVEGNISLFSDECLSIHGLYDAFYSRNGWGRTAVYLGSWILFGFFFLFLTLPLVRDFQSKQVVSRVEFEEGTSDGLPYPIVTACPHGNGIRCDCLLWRKLHCRYTVDIPNTEWQRRFTTYGCIDEFAYDEQTGELFWVNPHCDDFSNKNITLTDPCQASQGEINELPFLENITTEAIFDAVVARENSSGDGPYITYEEVMVYGSRRLTQNVHFFRGESPIRNQLLKPVPPKWIVKGYLEPSRFQICVQFRAPFSEKQIVPGARNGIALVIDHITDDLFSVDDTASATSAIDLHINVVDPARYDDSTLYVERHTFFPIAAGAVMDIEYSVTERIRKQGWGPQESRTCSNNVIPRSSCVEQTLMDRAIVECNCSGLQFLNGHLGEADPPRIAGCSASEGTNQNECIDFANLRGYVSIEECPTQCESTHGEVGSTFQVKLSEKQVRYTKHLLSYTGDDSRLQPDIDETIIASETAIIRIGLTSLFTVKFVEDSKVSLGALLGQIGGNAGLWCGLSFVLMIESLEFVVVALLYGSGFYTGGPNALRHRAKSIFRRGRRTKTSRN